MSKNGRDTALTSLSRRRLLGGMATIGAAGALGGAGTMAFFSDEETFANNRLAAGELDLKVDWEEHYSDWSSDEDQFARMEEPEEGAAHVIRKPGDEPDEDDIVAYFETEEDLQGFMDATAIEAFPDINNDSYQDPFGIAEQEDPCDVLGDMPGALSSDARTAGTFGGQTTAPGDPLIKIDDVKPGDFGEVTFSLHLCDNPGYIWLQGELVEALENGVSESESGHPEEDFPEGDTVELLDEIQTMFWYDEDCDNVYEPQGVGGEVDVVIVIDESGSMATGTKMEQAKAGAISLINALALGPSAAQVGVVSFADDALPEATLRQGLTTNAANAIAGVNAIPDNPPGNAFTNMEAGVQAGREELTGADVSNDIVASGNDRDGVEKIMVFLGDGAPNRDNQTPADGSDPINDAQEAKDDGIEIFTIGYDITVPSTAADILSDMASPPSAGHFFIADTTQIEQVFENISQAIAGEECFWTGTLRETLDLLSTGHGIPLDGNRATGNFEEVTPENTPGDGDSELRDCYINSTTNCIGFQWWLPVDHGDHVQGDSVTFDLSFYTEQCRHNAGSGLDAGNNNDILT